MVAFVFRTILIHVLVISVLSFSNYRFTQQNSDLPSCSSLDCSELAIFHFPGADSTLSIFNSSAILYLNSLRTLGWIPSVHDALLPFIWSVSSELSHFLHFVSCTSTEFRQSARETLKHEVLILNFGKLMFRLQIFCNCHSYSDINNE